MNAMDHVPTHSWEFGNGPGDDTILMDAADAALNLQPSKVTFEPPSELTKENSISRRVLAQPARTSSNYRDFPVQPVSAPSVSPTHSARKPWLTKGSPPQPETPLPRTRSTPSSTLSDDVDKVIRYLDAFRVNRSAWDTTVTDENKAGNRFGKDGSSGRQNFRVVDTVLFDATNNDLSILEDVRKFEGTNSIFRDSSLRMLPSPAAPTIYKANSIHSLQRKDRKSVV